MVCADKIDSLLQCIDNLIKSPKFVLQIWKNAYCINDRVTIFSLPKRRTFLDNNYYQPYKLLCKAGKISLDICWTLTTFDN